VSALARLIGLEVNQVWVWWSLRLVFDLGAPGEKDTYVDFTTGKPATWTSKQIPLVRDRFSQSCISA